MGTGKLTKPQIAQMKVQADMGYSTYAISKEMGIDWHTAKAYLMKYDTLSDPDIKNMVDIIKKRELNDLHAIGAKSRVVLNQYLDDVLDGKKEPNPISITVIVDRTFQQRQLPGHKPTEILSIRSMVASFQGDLDRLKQMREMLGGR